MAHSSSDWWKDLPCHLCPEWNLKGEIHLDVRKLKQSVDWALEDDLEFLPIENLLYRAFLEVPPERFLMRERSSPKCALELLQEADDKVERMWKDNEEVQNSYKLMINAFRMWLYNDGRFRETSKVDELTETLTTLKATTDTTSNPYIDVTRAVALSRLGLGRYDEAIELLTSALSLPQHCGNNPNKYWLFSKAVLIGRKARSESQNARGKMSRKQRKELFGPEKLHFEEILAICPDFAWAKAHLGRCLFNLGKRDKGRSLAHEAHIQLRSNRDIAKIYAKVLFWGGEYAESVNVLTGIRNLDESEKVLFQLGLIYSKMAEKDDLPEIQRQSYITEAIKSVEQAIQLDKNHIPALTKLAELTAELGRSEEARHMFLDLLQAKNMSPQQQYYTRCLWNGKPNIASIFSPKEILDNAYKILLLCTDNDFAQTTTYSENGHKEFVEAYKQGTNEAFEVIQSEIDSRSELNLDARRYLSDIAFRLGKFQQANTILTVLQREENRPTFHSHILLRRGKCLCELGYVDEAEGMANQLLSTQAGEGQECRELFADIFLMRARSALEQDWTLLSADQRISAKANLSKAIDHGSLEACYMFLVKVMRNQSLDLCKEKSGMAEILADIKECLGRKDHVHCTFEMEQDSSSEASVIDAIQRQMRKVLEYPKSLNGLPYFLKTRYELMTKIRTNLIHFEHSFKFISGSNWDGTCQEIAENLLMDARILLDHTIYTYQRAVLDKNPANTNFPIHNKSAKKNTSVDAKFDGYLGKYFSGANPPVPKHIRDYLIAIQPMVSDDNGWLNALAGFVNDAKHKGSDCGPTYQFCDEARFKKEDLVRISCCRVEEISVTLLEYVEDLYNKGLTRPGFLHETDRQTV